MSYLKYKKYQDLGEWWENEGRGKFPIQICMAITKLQKTKKLSFQEAFELLIGKKVIIMVPKNKKIKSKKYKQ